MLIPYMLSWWILLMTYVSVLIFSDFNRQHWFFVYSCCVLWLCTSLNLSTEWFRQKHPILFYVFSGKRVLKNALHSLHMPKEAFCPWHPNWIPVMPCSKVIFFWQTHRGYLLPYLQTHWHREQEKMCHLHVKWRLTRQLSPGSKYTIGSTSKLMIMQL